MTDVAADPHGAVVEALRESGAHFEVMDCDPDFADTAAFCERYGIAAEESVNTILVVGKSEPRRYVACVVLATTRLDVNGIVRQRLGVKKASFASADETSDLTGMLIGGVTPVALPDDIPIWIDAAVMKPASIVLGGGDRSTKLRMTPATLATLPRVEIVQDLAR